MQDMTLLLTALFLPLFPLSMVFNALFTRIQHVALRVILLATWPQIGLAILFTTDTAVPTWMLTWALITALLYAFRMLALRDVGQWTSFLATSWWAVLWLLATDHNQDTLQLYAIGLTIPFILLTLLSANLIKQFGAAYSGLHGGLAQSMPRFSGVLVVVILASIATPLFPNFFIMLKIILNTSSAMPIAILVLLVIWLLWSWAGVRLLQGLIVGTAKPGSEGEVSDIKTATSWLYALILITLVAGSVYFSGVFA